MGATPFGQHPKHLIVDNNSKYGEVFTRVAQATSNELVHTAYRAPQENAICERFLGSVRRECLDHLLVLGEAQLRRILLEYMTSFNHDRPHQGLQQQILDRPKKIALRSDGCVPTRSWAACTIPITEQPEG